MKACNVVAIGTTQVDYPLTLKTQMREDGQNFCIWNPQTSLHGNNTTETTIVCMAHCMANDLSTSES